MNNKQDCEKILKLKLAYDRASKIHKTDVCLFVCDGWQMIEIGVLNIY